MKETGRMIAKTIAAMALALIAGCHSGGDDNPAVLSGNPAPSISSVSPGSVVVAGQGFILTINGSNFMPGSTTVQFNGSAKTPVVVSAAQLTIEVTAADIATAGSREVMVTNPAPGGGSATAMFVVKGVPWVTAAGADVQRMKKTGGLLYAAYAVNGDVLLCRFDANGDKVAIAGQTDIMVANFPENDFAYGIDVFGGNAYVVTVRESVQQFGFGQVFLEKINLTTGERTERNIEFGAALTGFASDGANAICIAFNVFGHSAVRMVDVNANVLFEQAFAAPYNVSAVAVDKTAIYMGGVITNATGGQVRIFARKVDRNTGVTGWESQATAFERSPNDDTLYPRSFILDTAADALYLSGAIDFLTPASQGALMRMQASSGAFVFALVLPNTMDKALNPLVVGGGRLYGYNLHTDTIFLMDPTTGEFVLKALDAGQPSTIYAAGDVLYVSGKAGNIIRLDGPTMTLIR